MITIKKNMVSIYSNNFYCKMMDSMVIKVHDRFTSEHDKSFWNILVTIQFCQVYIRDLTSILAFIYK